MERNLAMELVRVTEAAALGSARLMGRGDETAADMAAVEAMRNAIDVLPVDGTVVIGEGDHDAMPMLYVSERVGTGQGPELDVACDALEGAAICATGGYNALSVIAIADRGSLLRVPDSYMDKIACGPEGRGIVDLDRSPTENLRALADAKGVYVEDLTVVILDRPRHTRLIEEVRRAGARIKLISSGDVSAALATTEVETGIDILMGIGGASQGILAAAALVCLGGEMQARLKPRNEEEAAQARGLGIFDLGRQYGLDQLASGPDMFARLEELDVPVVAALNGVALGGGLELALAGDLIVASERARLGQPEINLGLIPGFGGTQRLALRVGLARARELVYLGHMISAEEGHRIGLVNRVVPPDRLRAEAAELAAALAAKAPVALRQAKRATAFAAAGAVEAGCRYEIEAFGVTFATEDRVEGLRAFREKRTPVWKGR